MRSTHQIRKDFAEIINEATNSKEYSEKEKCETLKYFAILRNSEMINKISESLERIATALEEKNK